MKHIICTILIAEDEEIERDSLLALLREHYWDSVQIKCAKNGLEAVELYKEMPYDIVLMDINMPKMNGLEAIEQMKRVEHHTVFLILTSYDYFNYARDAIRLGVEDFLLKPIKPTTIIETVSHAITKLKVSKHVEDSASALVHKYAEIKPMLENECMYAILTRQRELDIQEKIKRLNITVKTAVCMIIDAPSTLEKNMRILKEDICDVGYSCLYMYMKQHHIFFLMYNGVLVQQDLEVIEQLLAQYHIRKYPIGIGSIQEEIKNFASSYDQAMRRIHQYVGQEALHFPIAELNDIPKDFDIQYYTTQLIYAFQRSDEPVLGKQIHDLAAELLPMRAAEIEEIVHKLLDNVIQQLQGFIQREIDSTSLPAFTIHEHDKSQTLEVSLHYVFQSLFHPILNERYQESSALAKKAMAYIQKNYQHPLSLNDVAKYLCVTPFYVSKIIKASFDKNFTNVVAEARINEAKRLLKENHRVKEIAYEVGFQSQSYFAKMFKKMVGMTPSEYQNLFL